MIMKPIAQTAKEMFLLGSFEDHDINTIVMILKAADEQYFNQDQSFLMDVEYDGLKQYAVQLQPNHSYFLGVGAEVRGGKIRLPYPMGSLDQIYEGEITDWVGDHSLQNENMVVSNKLDGQSVMIVYDADGNLQIAYSRGNGIEGADVTRHIRQIPSVPKTVIEPCLVVRGEVIFPIHKFEEIKQKAKNRSGKEYKNARNAITGIMNAESNDPIVYPAIDFIAHGIVNSGEDKMEQLDRLMRNRFMAVANIIELGKKLTDEYLTYLLNTNRKVSEYEIDGLVVEADSAFRRKEMTPKRETINSGYAVKYKVADFTNVAITKVVNVEWNVSKHGYLKPRVEVEPVKLVGVTIKHATGFNAKFISDNKIGSGAEVQITRSGDVIPFIQKVLKPAASAAMPDVEWAWNETEVDALILNKHESEEVHIQQTLNFFRTLNAPLLKEGTVRTMFELCGYIDAEEAIQYMLNYSLKEWVDSVGVNGKKIYQGLKQLLNGIPLYMLMGASPFFGRGLGTRKFKQLFKSVRIESVNDLSNITFAQIIGAEGFDEKTANKVLNGMMKFIHFYNNITDKTVVFDSVSVTGGTMTGQVVVFTGYRNKELEVLIEGEGGKIGSSVSGKTTLLTVADPNENSGKLKKARDLGIRIVSENELRDILGV